MKKNLSMKFCFAIATVAFGLTAARLPAMACSNLGPDKHLGVVQTIDAEKGELTVIDAESRKPILFSIGGDQIQLVKPNDTVIITFRSEAGRLFVQRLMVQPVKMSAR